MLPTEATASDRGRRNTAEEVLEVIEELKQGQITQRFSLSLDNAIVLLKNARDYFSYRKGMVTYPNMGRDCIAAYYVVMPALRGAHIFVGKEEGWVKGLLETLEGMRDGRVLPDMEKLNEVVEVFRAIKKG